MLLQLIVLFLRSRNSLLLRFMVSRDAFAVILLGYNLLDTLFLACCIKGLLVTYYLILCLVSMVFDGIIFLYSAQKFDS